MESKVAQACELPECFPSGKKCLKARKENAGDKMC